MCGHEEFIVQLSVRCQNEEQTNVLRSFREMNENEILFGIFPKHVLELDRKSFNRWKKDHSIRKRKKSEQGLVTRIRRTLLARVYAQRTREKQINSFEDARVKINELKHENRKLRQIIQELERERSKKCLGKIE